MHLDKQTTLKIIYCSPSPIQPTPNPPRSSLHLLINITKLKIILTILCILVHIPQETTHKFYILT